MSEINWVKARSDCTPEKVFQELAQAVKEDLSKHEQCNPRLASGLEFGSCEGGKFFVKRVGSHLILFEQTDSGIQVSMVPQKGEEKCLLNLSIAMNDAGGCVLSADGDELEPWQVRRRALEETFFGA